MKKRIGALALVAFMAGGCQWWNVNSPLGDDPNGDGVGDCLTVPDEHGFCLVHDYVYPHVTP